MKTLEDIKRRLFDKKADENNTIDLNAYAIGLNEMGKEIEKYAKEVAIASLEKASENAKVNCNHEEVKKEFTDIDSGYLYFVDKKSITNEENIVL